MKLAFMGTPDFALPALKALIDSNVHEVACVITQPDKPKGRGREMQAPPIKSMAKKHAIPVLQPASLKSNEKFYNLLKDINPEAVIVAAYGKMIPQAILDIPARGFINIHASVLPEYRGASPINRVIMNSRDRTGISIMKVDSGMDSGPVYLKTEIEIDAEDDALSLSHKLSILGADKLLEALDRIEHTGLDPIPQDDSQATYAPMIKKSEGLINWDNSAPEIHNMIRGLVPWPCAYTRMNSRLLLIRKSAYIVEGHQYRHGTMIKQGSEIKIACKDGFIKPKIIQLEGKKALDSASFACGLRSSETVLES